MAEETTIRLNKVLRELNISLDRAVEFLNSKGHDVEARPTTKISTEVYNVLLGEFQTDKSKKVASKEVGEEKRKEKEAIRLELEKENELKRQAQEQEVIKARTVLSGPKTVGKIDLEPKKVEEEVAEVTPEEKPEPKEEPVVELMPEIEKSEPAPVEEVKEVKEEVKEVKEEKPVSPKPVSPKPVVEAPKVIK